MKKVNHDTRQVGLGVRDIWLVFRAGAHAPSEQKLLQHVGPAALDQFQAFTLACKADGLQGV